MSEQEGIGVLIVAKTRVARDSSRLAATATGCRPTAVETLEEAEAALERAAYHLAVVEIESRGDEGGFACLETLRGLDSDLPIVLATTNPTVECAVRAFRSMAWDFLRVPISVDEFSQCLEHAAHQGRLPTSRSADWPRRLGQAIRDRRNALGLTQLQLSRRTGVSNSMLSQLELGKSCATLNTLVAIAAGLETTPGSLLDLESPSETQR